LLLVGATSSEGVSGYY